MAIMSVSICTAGGLTQSEPTHHTPKMQKYKLKKEKKERKLTGMQIAKMVVIGLMVATIIACFIVNAYYAVYLTFLLYFYSMFSITAYPVVKKEVPFIFFILGVVLSYIGLALSKPYLPIRDVKIISIAFATLTFITLVFLLLFHILTPNSKKTS
jgi:hypothetical protein